MSLKLENVKLMVLHTGKELKQHLLGYIDKASYCIGCVAWCTDLDILDHLAAKKGVQIVVQNDKVATRNYKHDTFRTRVKEKYRNLRKFDWPNWEKAFWTGIPNIPPSTILPSQILFKDKCSIRYAGCRQTQEARTKAKEDDQISMMHHKFLLYADDRGRIYGVSFGSFNFTYNASQSDENLVYIEDPRVVQHFFMTYLDVLQHSNPIS